MRIFKRTIWCLSSLFLLSSASLAQNRAAGGHRVDQRQAMQDRVRAIRHSLSNPGRSLSRLPIQVDQARQEGIEGTNFVNIIPFVTKENGSRTNVGINNFSQSSLAREGRPTATVEIGLYGPSGDLDRSGIFSVRSNEMLQINHIINVLDPVQGGGSATTGWLLIFSDEPVTAWASVILDQTSNDPAMLVAIADQIFKPAAFVESQGTPSNPLLIYSSVKGGAFKSRLAVVNIGSGAGRVRVKLFSQAGALQEELPAVAVEKNEMFVSDDIRMPVPGTFGPITIEVEDVDTNDDALPRIVATSLIESTTGPFAGFLPAFALPQPTTSAIAGVWEGSVTGGITNAEVRLTLYQERDMLYGSLEILSGAFPTTDRFFDIKGDVIDGSVLLEIQQVLDDCRHPDSDPCTVFAYRLFAESLSGNTLSGDSVYIDGSGRSGSGGFTLDRMGAIYTSE
ncbi:MAG: hypothetical protein F4X19_13065 [Acidobacteria bacterium]|nr:hypothetical protein [Acidobacteriota bacterium]